MDGKATLPRVILFEMRALIRGGICASLKDRNFNVVQCYSLEHLTEELCVQSGEENVLLIGAGGLGSLVSSVLRTLRFTQTMPLTSIVYFPCQDELLAKLFIAAGAHHALTEDALEDALEALICAPALPRKERVKLSPAELNVLLDYASGMDTREVASRRNCNYKTVFTFKRNACVRLDIETKSGWTTLMSSLGQLTSIYD
ncbi:helix-turn-helix transcriptional regulator [Enterobacter soli]|uniref:helix-turn-helix transcriptional regulator n=1 Tax=Enterobacter soli TaxID=885040 RepID=UPI0034CD0A9B